MSSFQKITLNLAGNSTCYKQNTIWFFFSEKFIFSCTCVLFLHKRIQTLYWTDLVICLCNVQFRAFYGTGWLQILTISLSLFLPNCIWDMGILKYGLQNKLKNKSRDLTVTITVTKFRIFEVVTSSFHHLKMIDLHSESRKRSLKEYL